MQTAAPNAIAITVAVPPSRIATPAHIAPQESETAQRGVLWPDDTIRASLAGCAPRQVDAAGDDLAHQVVDEREVLVVDVALLDLPRLEERGSSGLA